MDGGLRHQVDVSPEQVRQGIFEIEQIEP